MTCHDPRVLIIDDELQMRRFLRMSLSAQGYLPIEASTGAEGIGYVSSSTVDIVLLDMGLPDLDGTDVARQLREWTQAPIIVLSARTEEKDKLSAFAAGADDYLTKPFSIGELLARMRLARAHAAPRSHEQTDFNAGELRVDLRSSVVFVAGREVHLTPIEYRLLMVLIQNVGRVVTHQDLLKGVWGARCATRAQYLHVYIGRLRAKLDLDLDQAKLLVTVPGIGYRLRASEPERENPGDGTTPPPG